MLVVLASRDPALSQPPPPVEERGREERLERPGLRGSDIAIGTGAGCVCSTCAGRMAGADVTGARHWLLPIARRRLMLDARKFIARPPDV